MKTFFDWSSIQFLDLFDCLSFLFKKYGKSNHNIFENFHYLYLKIVIICLYFMSSSHFLFIFLIEWLDSL